MFPRRCVDGPTIRDPFSLPASFPRLYLPFPISHSCSYSVFLMLFPPYAVSFSFSYIRYYFFGLYLHLLHIIEYLLSNYLSPPNISYITFPFPLYFPFCFAQSFCPEFVVLPIVAEPLTSLILSGI